MWEISSVYLVVSMLLICVVKLSSVSHVVWFPGMVLLICVENISSVINMCGKII